MDEFYKSAWDRLTEGGKEAMSHRVWEGIRHGEEKFSELLENIKEKESKRIYDFFGKRDNATIQIEQIPEADKKDFVRAYESGNKEAAYKILDRQSFTNNVSLSAPNEMKSVAAQQGQEADSKEVKSASENPSEHITRTSAEDLPSVGDLNSINLKGLKIADASAQGVAANTLRSEAPAKRSL